jgi:hypothetical protein
VTFAVVMTFRSRYRYPEAIDVSFVNIFAFKGFSCWRLFVTLSRTICTFMLFFVNVLWTADRFFRGCSKFFRSADFGIVVLADICLSRKSTECPLRNSFDRQNRIDSDDEAFPTDLTSTDIGVVDSIFNVCFVGLSHLWSVFVIDWLVAWLWFSCYNFSFLSNSGFK